VGSGIEKREVCGALIGKTDLNDRYLMGFYIEPIFRERASQRFVCYFLVSL